MRLKPEQLVGHLKKGPLAPVYIISGDEPLQAQEAADAIRAAARRDGVEERLVFNVEAGFDWNALNQAAHTLSLFAQRRLLDLRLPNGKPGDTGARVLIEYAEQGAEGDILLLTLPKLDQAKQKSKWFKALEARGVWLAVWPVAPNQLPGWIAHRARGQGLHLSREAAALLGERVEGNLLAAAQELDKLALLVEGEVDEAAVLNAVADSAVYDIFGLVDAALDGDARRYAHMLDHLRASGAEGILVLWAMAKAARTLARMAAAPLHGVSVDAVLKTERIWDKQAPRYKNAFQRLGGQRSQRLLRRAFRVDRMIKGMEAGNYWDELLKLGVSMSGQELLRDRI